MNTAYVKGSKINLVLSQGKKIDQAISPQPRVGKNIKKLRQIHEKKSKDKHSKK